jgi:hypothetical protein
MVPRVRIWLVVVFARAKEEDQSLLFVLLAGSSVGRSLAFFDLQRLSLVLFDWPRFQFSVWANGGDQLGYPGNVSTPIAKLTTAKCLINSIISTKDARAVACNLKDFYRNTTEPLRIHAMRMHISIIPNKIIEQYNLMGIVTPNRWVYIEIRKGMYGLKQAGIIANQCLTKHHRSTYGYSPTPCCTPSMVYAGAIIHAKSPSLLSSIASLSNMTTNQMQTTSSIPSTPCTQSPPRLESRALLLCDGGLTIKRGTMPNTPR